MNSFCIYRLGKGARAGGEVGVTIVRRRDFMRSRTQFGGGEFGRSTREVYGPECSCLIFKGYTP